MSNSEPKPDDATGVQGADFGLALKLLKAGQRMQRVNWNGAGQWVVLIRAGNAMHRTTAGAFDMQDCFGLKNSQGNMQPGWVPSQGDLLAEDWQTA